MQTYEWMTIGNADETQLFIEVTIFEDGGQLIAEPSHYTMLASNGEVLIDGPKRSKWLKMKTWRVMKAFVDGVYTPAKLADMRDYHPAFERLRRDDLDQQRMDREWHRRNVL